MRAEKAAMVGRPPKSKTPISPTATNLIVAAEVTGEQAYTAHYHVTIGIGYDLGDITPTYFKEDWQGYRAIKTDMQSKNFSDIPAQFRSMERLWKNIPDDAGLVLRREAEAALFAAGPKES